MMPLRVIPGPVAGSSFLSKKLAVVTWTSSGLMSFNSFSHLPDLSPTQSYCNMRKYTQSWCSHARKISYFPAEILGGDSGHPWSCRRHSVAAKVLPQQGWARLYHQSLNPFILIASYMCCSRFAASLHQAMCISQGLKGTRLSDSSGSPALKQRAPESWDRAPVPVW